MGEVERAIVHGFSQGGISLVQGGDFGSGALGSLSAAGAGTLLKDASFGFELFSLTASGALTGGVGSVIAGGGFWDGFRNGAIISALNYGLHGVDDDRLRTEKHAEAVRAFLKKKRISC